MKNGASEHDESYKRMQEKPDYQTIVKRWKTMRNYLSFYEDWIKTCCAISKSKKNPNRALLEAWKR